MGQEIKLGARCLSKEEMNLILPNAEAIDNQIEKFRNDIKEGMTDQKTNNIGIMGRRGAGKTSVLQTFHKKLNPRELNDRDLNDRKETQKECDIILPIIIPENMSSKATLMDIILGMLKPYVKEKKMANMGDCIYEGRNELEKSYNRLLRHYCYIKDDYRNILMQQFTTEQYYVDKTTEIFNSDTEFIKLFRDFIDTLLCEGNQKSKAMLFIFIDDIDLSTTRCIDVVKTLLSYLSHQRIVTFISGDITTFEEALTLEFLRQEKGLSNNVFKESYCTERKSNLLERKQELSYEYLKKIIPPAYRYEVKSWSLEERGRYKVTDEKDGSKDVMDLSDLLYEVIEGKEKYFRTNEGENISVMFHLFDDTSRGLNNVYNVLQELYSLKKPEGEKASLPMWRLIETIVNSKLQYARFKDRIFQNIIVREENAVKVNFKSLAVLLYPDGEDNNNVSEEEESKGGKTGCFMPEDKFALFLLADFARWIFTEGIDESDDYIELKKKIINEYVNHEGIDGELEIEKKEIDIWKGRDKLAEITSVLKELLEKGDFRFALYLIKYIGRQRIISYFNNELKDRKDKYLFVYSFVQTVNLLYSEEKKKQYLVNLYLKMSEVFQTMLGWCELDPDIIIGYKLVGNAVPYICETRFLNENDGTPYDCFFMNVENYMHEARMGKDRDKVSANLLMADYRNSGLRFWCYYEREEKNTGYNVDWKKQTEYVIQNGMIKALMNQLEDVFDNYSIKAISQMDYEEVRQGKNQKKDLFIELVDEKNLWERQYIKDKVIPYIEKKRMEWMESLLNGRILFNVTELLHENGAYQNFKKCDKGTSNQAYSIRLLNEFEKILFLLSNSNSGGYDSGDYYISLDHLLVLQYKLTAFMKKHPRIRYAKREILQLSKKLEELPILVKTNQEEWNRIQNEVKTREDNFFNKEFMEKGYDKVSIFNCTQAELEKEVEQYRQLYYSNYSDKDSNSKLNLASLIKAEKLRKNILIGDNNIYYLMYLVQKKQIETLKDGIIKGEKASIWENVEKIIPEEEEVSIWENLEKIIPVEEYNFYFHSYLRYLQMSEGETGIDGKKAEMIAEMAKELLDNEVEGDRQIQNEVYDILQEELELTEEEFEKLFE